jgi:hypothetical protein
MLIANSNGLLSCCLMLCSRLRHFWLSRGCTQRQGWGQPTASPGTTQLCKQHAERVQQTVYIKLSSLDAAACTAMKSSHIACHRQY